MVEKVEVNLWKGRDSQRRILGEQMKLMLRYYEPLSLFHPSMEQRVEMNGIKLGFW